MFPETTIRLLSPSDNPSEIVGMFQRSMPYFAGYEREVVQALADHFSRPNDRVCFVAVRPNGDLAGVIGYVLETQDIYQVGWFAVDNKFKRMGLGTALLRYIEKELSGRARLLMAEVWDSKENEPALNFYIKNGFLPTATIPDYYSDDDGDMTFFVKRLKPKE